MSAAPAAIDRGIAPRLVSAGRSLMLALALVWASPPGAAEQVIEGSRPREVCDDRDQLKRAFFGDLHVHTVFSLDASTMGTRNRPADAYRYARGEKLGIQPYGADDRPLRSVQLERPLDFAAVTDHAELLGEWKTCNTPGLPGHDSWVCRTYRKWPRVAFFWMNMMASRGNRHDFCGPGAVHCLEAARGPWQETRDASETAYDRSSACQFTAFTAYEWTGAVRSGNNFHRNVIFANDIVPERPISFLDEPVLGDFWAALGAKCSESGSGCDAVVIPHNSNLSGGEMFQTTRPDGSPITAEDARARARHEVLVEIMQHKGESECMLGLETEDELCQFENLTMNSFSGLFLPRLAEPPMARQFVRNTLKEGLAQHQSIGVNPFRFGIIASSDTHLGTPGLVEESASYPGHGGAGKPPGDTLTPGLPDSIEFNPGGLAVVWAEENSRASIFAGLRQRETYGTSGPRMVLRFFGGWDYAEDMCEQPGLAEQGYAQGVPMGSVLPARSDLLPPDSGPVFAVSVLADPGTSATPSTPLQRLQIVKGWLEAGEKREKVFEVAGNPANGASVDPNTCETSGPGASTLCGVFRDPDFRADQRAFYYARAIENPTCRWSQKLCLEARVRCDDAESISAGLEACCSEGHQPAIQERAWSSPIWYEPPPS